MLDGSRNLLNSVQGTYNSTTKMKKVSSVGHVNSDIAFSIAEKSPKDRSEKTDNKLLRYPFLLIPSSYSVTFLLIIAKTCLILILSLFATI